MWAGCTALRISMETVQLQGAAHGVRATSTPDPEGLGALEFSQLCCRFYHVLLLSRDSSTEKALEIILRLRMLISILTCRLFAWKLRVMVL